MLSVSTYHPTSPLKNGNVRQARPDPSEGREQRGSNRLARRGGSFFVGCILVGIGGEIIRDSILPHVSRLVAVADTPQVLDTSVRITEHADAFGAL